MKVQHRSSISVVKSDETAVCFDIKYVRHRCVVNLISRTSDLVCGVVQALCVSVTAARKVSNYSPAILTTTS